MSVPVTIVSSGGFPVNPVRERAPTMKVTANGAAITLAQTGAPFIVFDENGAVIPPIGEAFWFGGVWGGPDGENTYQFNEWGAQ